MHMSCRQQFGLCLASFVYNVWHCTTTIATATPQS
uniref:Uncharacterized protein n=1 Tax=Setaria viridis TaxID=4556 RepID=A0A4U6TZ81_SETVI|nr:hypothetical protein SEVIR_7G004005v2 [Setaria viridis]